jgi:hypothetical protein
MSHAADHASRSSYHRNVFVLSIARVFFSMPLSLARKYASWSGVLPYPATYTVNKEQRNTLKATGRDGFFANLKNSHASATKPCYSTNIKLIKAQRPSKLQDGSILGQH